MTRVWADDAEPPSESWRVLAETFPPVVAYQWFPFDGHGFEVLINVGWRSPPEIARDAGHGDRHSRRARSSPRTSSVPPLRLTMRISSPRVR